ncbi:MAG: hypothetical protein WAQ24_00475 [Candidatus Saccharimonadales bacterium]
MDYSFSWSWFGTGIIVLLASAALVIWHRPVADNFGSGVSSYERYRLWGLIGCGVGLLTMLNVHTLLLGWFFGMLFGRGS